MASETTKIRQPLPSDTSRERQRGGVAILVALVLTLVMGAAALGLARNSLRELGITGTLVQGTKADKAADAGLDWFLTWSHPDNVKTNAGTTATAQGVLAATLVGLKTQDFAAFSYPADVTVDSATRPWDRAATITSPVSDAATNDMVFDTTGAQVKQARSGGNAVVQKFDLVIRYLGAHGGGGVGDPSGGTDPRAAGTTDLLWQITSRGSANIPSAGLAFTQNREIVGLQSRSQD